MLGVHPYLSFPGSCRAAIDFYCSALGAQVLFLQTVGESPMQNMGPPDDIMHCTMQVGDSVIMMSDDRTPDAPSSGGNISLSIGVDDPDRAGQLFDNLAQDGSVLMPLAKTYWAERFGMVADKFGVRWIINCDLPHPAH